MLEKINIPKIDLMIKKRTVFTNDIFALIQYLPIDILSILKRKLLNIILINIWRKKITQG